MHLDQHDRIPVLAWSASPVRLGRIPGWLKKRLTPHRRRLQAVDHVDTLQRLARCGGGGSEWLDHWGSTLIAGAERFVSEPYPMPACALRALLRFAELLDLDISIHATSAHNPTGCLRIVFVPRLGPEQDRSSLEQGGRSRLNWRDYIVTSRPQIREMP